MDYVQQKDLDIYINNSQLSIHSLTAEELLAIKRGRVSKSII